MPVDAIKAVIGGLDLGTDPDKTTLVTLADSMRFPINGSATSRLGRKRLQLEFPEEAVEGVGDYTKDPFDMKAPGRTRGVAPFYDQRLFDVAPEILSNNDFENAASLAKWTLGGDFAFYTDENNLGIAAYSHSSGTGTLTQTTANMRAGAAPAGSVLYVLEYTVTQDVSPAGASVAMTFGGIAPAPAMSVSHQLGRHRYEFVADSAPGNFVFTITSNVSVPTAYIAIGDVSLKRVALRIALPTRLNFVYKFADKLWFNNHYFNSTDGILDGDTLRGGTFNDIETRAQVVTRKDEVYIADPSTRLKIMRRLPVDESTYLAQTKYNVGPCGLDWPQTNKDRCQAAFSTDSAKKLATGIYRFRVAVENRYGDVSNPSLVSREVVAVTNQFATITFPPTPQTNLIGWIPTKWRVYVSYQGGYVDDSGGAGAEVFRVVGTEPTEFKLWKSFDITETSAEFTGNDMDTLTDHPRMPPNRGVMPKMSAFKIIGETGYGIPGDDIVRREVVETQSDGTPLDPSIPPDAWAYFPQTDRGFGTRMDLTQIKDLRFGPQYLVVSPPGEPQYMFYWIKFATGDEEGIAIEEMGHKPIIFTNLGILIYDPLNRRFDRSPAEIGTFSRDSVKKTEKGIRFMGTDGIPRLFNGATVEELADEVSPIFAKEDYSGYYRKLDRRYINEVSAAFGGRKWMMSYPVSDNPGGVPAKAALDSAPEQNLLIGDSTRQGRTQWSVDAGSSYEQMLWLGREGKMVGVDFGGSFFSLEEGLVDEQVSGNDKTISWAWAPRWFGGTVDSKFTVVRVMANTMGADVTVKCQVDEDPDLQHEYTINSTQAEEFRLKLPATFRGVSMEARFSGSVSTTGRPEIYDVSVEVLPLGVF